MMKRTIKKCATEVSMIMLLSVLVLSSTQPAHAADPLVERATGSASSIAEVGLMASGAAEDTLKACKARIPELASVGQRMLAEQSCASEEESRKAIRSAPQF
ncbi:MAG: hypothetical protein CV089_03150 [Nitrospira sp. WS110]|nr:hypothetical protein [Nitrospira sp. WS110]